MLKINYFKPLVYLFVFINLVLISGCNSYKKDSHDVSDTNSNKKIIKVFEDDSIYIFGDLIDKDIYSTYNADRLIFQVKVDNLSTLDYLNSIDSKLSKRGWMFKKIYKSSYVYCDLKINQLEIIPPLDLNYSYSFGEGQTIKQLPDVWNISFTHSIHKRYVCNSNDYS